MPLQSVTVELGERKFEIQEAPFLRSSPWRKRLMEEIKPLFGKLANAQDLEFERPEDLLKLWPLLESVLIDGIDKIFELFVSYSPALEEERDWIANHASERQIFQGFQEVLRLTDPLGLTQLFGRRIGLANRSTLSKSPSPNGATATETQPSD